MALKSEVLNEAYESFSDVIGSLSQLADSRDPLYIIASTGVVAFQLEGLISDVLPALVEELQTEDKDEIVGVFMGFLNGIFMALNAEIAILRNSDIDDLIWAQVRPMIQRKLFTWLDRSHGALKKSSFWKRLMSCLRP